MGFFSVLFNYNLLKKTTFRNSNLIKKVGLSKLNLSPDLHVIICDVIYINDLLVFFITWLRLIDNQINYYLKNYRYRDMMVFRVAYGCSNRQNKGYFFCLRFPKKKECEENMDKFQSARGLYKWNIVLSINILHILVIWVS